MNDLRFSARLDCEWRRLRRRRRSVVRARSWASAVDDEFAAVFATLTDLDELVQATQQAESGPGERLLLELVRLARHDQLAGRVVVQRVLPGLISATAPYLSWVDDGDAVEVAVGSLWIAIHAYDHERRRRHVAASLISDAIFKAFRQPARRRSATEDACAPERFEQLVAPDSPDALVEIVATLDEAGRTGVPREDIDLLANLVRVGSPRLIAAEADVTPRTIRNRRDRAIERVRLAVAPTAEQAA